MRKLLLLILTFIVITSFKERNKLISGEYDGELKIAYNPSNKLITGYFNSATGYDENTDRPKFTCIFYLEGKLENNKINIKTYYPLHKNDDLINGTLQLVDDSHLSIKLPEEHGGCWNVQHFSDNPVKFGLTEKHNWIEIRYVTQEKSNFYSEKNDKSKGEKYVIKGDIVYIEKIEDNWAYCYFYGLKTTKGWIKLESLNNVDL